MQDTECNTVCDSKRCKSPKCLPIDRHILWASQVALGKERICLPMQEFHPWGGKSPWRRKWQPNPVFLPDKSMDRGAWQATVHRVTKSQTRLSNIINMQQHLQHAAVKINVPIVHAMKQNHLQNKLLKNC